MRVQLPEYERRVWRRWVFLTAVVLFPAGLLTGFLFGDPANGEFDTALAWGSASRVLMEIGLGVWLWVLPGTAIYFERTNSRYRPQVTDGRRGKSPGFALAMTALFLGLFFLGPAALLVDYFAWKRISATAIPYARGAATAATACFAGVIGLALWIVSVPTL